MKIKLNLHFSSWPTPAI